MTPEAKPKPGSAMVVLAFYVLVAATFFGAAEFAITPGLLRKLEIACMLWFAWSLAAVVVLW
jgi:hypothetical protein